MSLAQHLLLRGLISKFWKEPYKNNLVRWGTDIHDRWMLPHFCETDFRMSSAICAMPAIRLNSIGSRRILSFVSRVIGDLEQRDLQSNSARRWSRGTSWARNRRRRHGALCGQFAGTSASQGARPDRRPFRHHLHGRRLPLHPTGTNGEFVAGVRYRAWQPPELSATDHRRRMRRSSSMSWTPGTSAASAAAPITSRIPAAAATTPFRSTAYEAESRRLSRFFRHGHTPGKDFMSRP